MKKKNYTIVKFKTSKRNEILAIAIDCVEAVATPFGYSPLPPAKTRKQMRDGMIRNRADRSGFLGA
jgi:hypothetical protein